MSTSKPSCRNTNAGVKQHLGTLMMSPAEKKSFRTRKHKRTQSSCPFFEKKKSS
jgi:hypothetical protein